MDDTIGEFIRENVDSKRDTWASPTDSIMAGRTMTAALGEGGGHKMNINEKYIQTKLDRICGAPRDNILYFSRQDIKDAEKKQKPDQTLGKYLEELVETAKLKCTECNLEKYHHSQEIYHKDGQI